MENKIIKLIKKRDEKALNYLVDIYSDKVYYIATQILKGYGSKEDIEECVSDVFLSVWNNINDYDNKKSKFETFIFIKAKYKSLDYKRKLLKLRETNQIKEDVLFEMESNLKADGAEKEFIKKQRIKELIEFIKKFKEPDKTYFYLKYFMEYDIKSIASKFEDSVSGVENRLYRCRLKLKNILGQE